MANRIQTKWQIDFTYRNEYHKVASSNKSRLEAHAGFFRLLMKGIFDVYVLWPFVISTVVYAISSFPILEEITSELEHYGTICMQSTLGK